MKFAQDIIRKPRVTEKATSLLEDNKYTFEVDVRANKSEIKRAVEELFKVKVLSVNTVRVKGKKVRRQKAVGFKPEVKKAIVTLAPGDRIEIYEGV